MFSEVLLFGTYLGAMATLSTALREREEEQPQQQQQQQQQRQQPPWIPPLNYMRRQSLAPPPSYVETMREVLWERRRQQQQQQISLPTYEEALEVYQQKPDLKQELFRCSFFPFPDQRRRSVSMIQMSNILYYYFMLAKYT